MNADTALATIRDAAAELRRLANEPYPDPALLRAIAEALARIAAEAER